MSESSYTDGGTDSLTFTEPSGSYNYSITPIAGWQQSNLSYTGTVVVSGAPVTEPTAVYTPVTYAVTFSESGLPAGQTWQVRVGGVPLALTTDGATDSLSALEPNGTYAYSIADVSGWHQSTLPYAGNVVVNGAPVSKSTLAYVQVTYSVVFSESGLAASLVWKVTVNGVMEMLATTVGTDTLTWTGLPNGTYAYSITAISGWNESTLPYGGNVTVSGGTTTEPTLVYSKLTYVVTFSEVGLPADQNFQVTVGREVQSVTTDGGNDTLSFLAPNGTSSYTIADVSGWGQSTLPYSGTVLVAGFAVTEPTLVYTQETYSVVFTESGLPGGTNWSVTFAGTPQNTTGSGLTFTEPNGTYSFVLGLVPGYSPSPGFGSKTVNGAGVSVGIAFTVVTYAVTFSESGLPGGTSWSVTIGVTTHTSTGAAVLFAEPNGTYGYLHRVGPRIRASVADRVRGSERGPVVDRRTLYPDQGHDHVPRERPAGRRKALVGRGRWPPSEQRGNAPCVLGAERKFRVPHQRTLGIRGLGRSASHGLGRRQRGQPRGRGNVPTWPNVHDHLPRGRTPDPDVVVRDDRFDYVHHDR